MRWQLINPVSREKTSRKTEFLVVFSIVTVAALSFFATPYMLIASFAYLCLFSGMVLRRERAIHPKLMMTGMATDLLLVLVLEFQRSAITTAVGFSLTLPQQLHIVFSLMAVLHYFPVFYLGLKRMNGTATLKQEKLHLRLGVMALAFRTLGFILMFTFLAKKNLG